MATNHKAIKAFYETLVNDLAEKLVEEGVLYREQDDEGPDDPRDYGDEPFDVVGRPKYLLCDEIWEILDEAGHGTPAIIHHPGEASEVIIYDRYASQNDNVKVMNHIFEAIESGCLVTVNGTDIFDLY